MKPYSFSTYLAVTAAFWLLWGLPGSGDIHELECDESAFVVSTDVNNRSPLASEDQLEAEEAAVKAIQSQAHRTTFTADTKRPGKPIVGVTFFGDAVVQP